MYSYIPRFLILPIAYLGSIILVCFIATYFLDLGDPKFGKHSWTLYWWIWSFMMSPSFGFGCFVNSKYVKRHLRMVFDASMILTIAMLTMFLFYIDAFLLPAFVFQVLFGFVWFALVTNLN